MDATAPHTPDAALRFRACRKWLVRLLVFTVVASSVGAGVFYQRWTNPAAMRRQVTDKLAITFQGVTVSLESAQLRLLGGIAIRDLRLTRSDDPDKVEFLYVPTGVIYHDKEQLAAGKLAIRKVELYRPRLRVVRGPDGKWNLAGVLAPSVPSEHVPTVVIHQGTVLLEDRQAAPGVAPVELKDVNLTLMNDRLLLLTFEGSAKSDLAGAVSLHGTRQRKTEETTLAVSAPAVQVGPPLIQRLAAYSVELAAHTRQLKGVAKLDADLTYRPAEPEPLHYEVRLNLSQGELSHALLPLPLDHVEAALRVRDGRVAEATATAHSGDARLTLTAKDVVPGPYRGLENLLAELDVHVEHLPIRPELFDPLPEHLKDIRNDFDPQGVVTLHFDFHREGPDQWRKHCRVEAEDARATFVKFPYPLEHIAGAVEMTLVTGQDDLVTIDLAGRAGGRPVTIKGKVVGERPGGVEVNIVGKDLLLDDKMLAALPEKYQALARSFNAGGLGDFVAYIRRARGSKDFTNRYVIHFHDARMRYAPFPYPAEKVSGDLDIYPGGWEFRDFKGSHNGGEFRGWARSAPLPRVPTTLTSSGAAPSLSLAPAEEPDRLEVHISGRNVAFDDELAAAVAPQPDLERTWQTFSPTGRFDFESEVVRLPGEKPDIDLTVYPKGCGITPRFFPYALHDLRGKVHYARRWVELDRVSARHGASAVSLEGGTVYLKPGGGIWAELVNVRGRPLVPDGDLLRALPPALKTLLTASELRDPVTLDTRLVIDSPTDPGPPTIYWDGTLALSDATLRTGVLLDHVTGQLASRGRHNGRQLEGVLGNFLLKEMTVFRQPLQDVQGQVLVTPEAPEVVQLPGLHARWCGGEVYGPMRVEFGPMVRYDLRLTAAKVKLEEFRKLNLGPNAQVSGLATADLYLSGQGADLNTLKGGGSIRVPDGKMYNLPLLLDLIKVLGMRPPDRTAFEEARADFEISGPQVKVERIDLFGNAVSLRGEGELTLDPADFNRTDVNLDFHVDWGRLIQALPPGIKKVPPAISDQLLTIKMRGPLGQVKYTKEPVPGIVDPFRRMFDAMRPDKPPPN